MLRSVGFSHSVLICSPILERRALYRLAVVASEVLAFGSFVQRLDGCIGTSAYSQLQEPTALARSLLSRRARGKIFDRIIIDYGHMHRLHVAEKEKAEKNSSSKHFQNWVVDFCRQTIDRMAVSSAIGFSAIRNMARRLKQPLAETMNSVECLESKELGLRFDNLRDASEIKATSKKYSDWAARTDRAVANALVKDDFGPGARCAFVGFEDEGELPELTSLNVEELAMELYRSGRLPAADASTPLSGGWTGWHDEGGHVRALFRILCSAPVLGMDFGCAHRRMSAQERHEHATVHLSPYQHAPFDLHVGYEVRPPTIADGMPTTVPSRGFYCRRAETISSFLLRLESLSSQGLSDLVYDSVASRLNNLSRAKQKDPSFDRDLLQVRTLSAIAAGFGGKCLAAVFRCFFYDYRHYCGGLPDLHLFRAIYESGDDSAPTCDEQLVDLGDWIGELFSADALHTAAARRGASLLCDRDDEFLGCSKVDSGSRPSRTNRGGKQSSNTASMVPSMDRRPERLRLFHSGRAVKVECMMIEVKSSNDRLDPRQEDWLNVLDQYGNARVCKFEDKSQSKKKQVTKKKSF